MTNFSQLETGFSRVWRRFLVLTCLAWAAMPAPACADVGFQQWVRDLWPAAKSAGISRPVYERAFAGVVPDAEILQRAENQPEFSRTMADYIGRMVSDERIANGRSKAAEYAKILDAVEALYGVDRYVVLAIWGVESGYGEHLGDKYVVQALATLGYRGERAKFGRQQLIAALKILQRGDTTAERMRGSWAGAMGHTQFIPTTYNAYAVDLDGDGRRDIWDTVPDALASTANYLRRSGWQPGMPWGYPVILPAGFDYALADETVRPLQQWRHAGVRRANGDRLSETGDAAALILPSGARGPAFLVTANFRAILRYNNSHAYVLGVGLLSDQLRGKAMYRLNWPADERPLLKADREELQGLLARRGYPVGKIDGIIGSGTRTAIRNYQRSAGLPADGYPSYDLLNRLRR